MKKIILITVLVLISVFGFTQVTNNFEDGNWLYYSNRCWGIGPNNTYYGTKVTSNGFNGTSVCETDNLGQTNICILESPWVDLIEGNIIFDHAIPSFNGTRKLSMYLVDNLNNTITLWSFSYQNNKPKSAIKYNDLTGIYKIRWKWEGTGGNSRGQLDNIVIPGMNVSDPSNSCNPIIPSLDTDGDGVPNSQDEYPIDPTRAYNNYYPASDTSTLVFEDLWPNYGDYDMNDLVIGYKFKIVSNSQHNVVEIFNTLVVRAQGAGMENGFGYQLNVNPNSILQVTGMGDQTGYNIKSTGTEIGNPSKATFIVFNNSHNVISCWNTVKGEITCPYKTFDIYIKFSTNSISLTQLDISKWNPFIITGNVRGREIHLPNYQPTEMVDVSYFGTGDDDTNPSISKYYKSVNNLPWALDITGKFNYPSEKNDISQAYLKFIDWVLSNGNSYQDWWSNLNSGYRNSVLIY